MNIVAIEAFELVSEEWLQEIYVTIKTFDAILQISVTCF